MSESKDSTSQSNWLVAIALGDLNYAFFWFFVAVILPIGMKTGRIFVLEAAQQAQLFYR